MPAGDTIAEAIAGAELRVTAVESRRTSVVTERRASIAAEKSASTSAEPGTSALAGRQADLRDESPISESLAEDAPTLEELATLRRVANNIPLKLFSIAFIELCERFSYYGTTVVCKS